MFPFVPGDIAFILEFDKMQNKKHDRLSIGMKIREI